MFILLIEIVHGLIHEKKNPDSSKVTIDELSHIYEDSCIDENEITTAKDINHEGKNVEIKQKPGRASNKRPYMALALNQTPTLLNLENSGMANDPSGPSISGSPVNNKDIFDEDSTGETNFPEDDFDMNSSMIEEDKPHLQGVN